MARLNKAARGIRKFFITVFLPEKVRPATAAACFGRAKRARVMLPQTRHADDNFKRALLDRL